MIFFIDKSSIFLVFLSSILAYKNLLLASSR